MSKLRLIDIARKGNVVRFYLGSKTDDWGWTNPDYVDSTGKTPAWLKPSDTYGGDDWDDVPYESNAGRVYDEFIKKTLDVPFPFDSIIIEPHNGVLNSKYCMDDFVARKAPRFIVISKDAQDALYDDGDGHSTWAYEGDYECAIKLIDEWQAQHHKLLDGVSRYFLGDIMEAQ